MPKKVIFITGPVKTGKTTIASEVSKSLGIYHYNISEIQNEIYPTDVEYEDRLRDGMAFSLETQQKICEKVADDFAQLTKKYYSIIVDDSLLERDTRKMLFEAARKTFGRYTVIQIRSNDDTIQERLEKIERPADTIYDPYSMYLASKKGYDAFDRPFFTVQNNGAIDTAVDEVCDIIARQL